MTPEIVFWLFMAANVARSACSIAYHWEPCSGRHEDIAAIAGIIALLLGLAFIAALIKLIF